HTAGGQGLAVLEAADRGGQRAGRSGRAAAGVIGGHLEGGRRDGQLAGVEVEVVVGRGERADRAGDRIAGRPVDRARRGPGRRAGRAAGHTAGGQGLAVLEAADRGGQRAG